MGLIQKLKSVNPLIVLLAGIAIGLTGAGLVEYIRRGQSPAQNRHPDLQTCLTTIEGSIANYKRAIAPILTNPKQSEYKDFVTANTELGKFRSAYDTSCQNIDRPEIKSLDNSVKAIATLLANFPQNTNTPDPQKIQQLQNALNEKGPAYAIALQGGQGNFGPSTKEQLAKYLKDSGKALTEKLNTIKATNIAVYLEDINHRIESQNHRFWWFLLSPIAAGSILGIALPFVFGRYLTKKYEESQQKIFRENTALIVAKALGASPPEGSRTQFLVDKALETSPPEGSRTKSFPVTPVPPPPPGETTKIDKRVPPEPPPKSPPPSSPSSTETLDDLPPRIRELVEEYNKKGWSDLRYQYPELKEASEPTLTTQLHLKGAENSPSVKIFETKKHNKGDYLVFELNPTFSTERSLWLFPKQVTGGRVKTIEYLFDVDEEVKKDYDKLKLKRPAQLDPQSFHPEEGKQWEVKLIKQGKIVPKEG